MPHHIRPVEARLRLPAALQGSLNRKLSHPWRQDQSRGRWRSAQDLPASEFRQHQHQQAFCRNHLTPALPLRYLLRIALPDCQRGHRLSPDTSAGWRLSALRRSAGLCRATRPVRSGLSTIRQSVQGAGPECWQGTIVSISRLRLLRY